MPVAAAFCESDWGWPGVYYVQGAVTFLLTAVFFACFRNQPRDHCLVSEDEAKFIEAGKNAAKREKVPYKAIFSDLPVWSIVVCFFGGSFGFYVLFIYGPIYLNKVLGFPVRSTGFAAAIPYVLSIVVKMFLGPVSDKLSCISERARVVMFATVSQGMLALCLIALAAVPPGNMIASQAFFTAVTVFSGFNILGAVKSAQLIARQHSHVVMTMTSFGTNIVTLVLPLCVALLAPDNLPEQVSN
ncbi:Protein F56A4.12 [Aphelenchoides avenae]|nr:Protein F56A4.12 [Aphelenchus avenae]